MFHHAKAYFTMLRSVISLEPLRTGIYWLFQRNMPGLFELLFAGEADSNSEQRLESLPLPETTIILGGLTPRVPVQLLLASEKITIYEKVRASHCCSSGP
jgi:hypothetical protein